MQSQTLYRLSGWTLTAGAALKTIQYLLERRSDDPLEIYTHPQFWVVAIGLVGSLLFLIGLPALYAYQAERAGKFGLISFVVVFFGLASLEIGSAPVFGVIFPFLAADPATKSLLISGGPLENYSPFMAWFLPGLIMANLGVLLYAIATIRARVYPRWAGIVILLGVPAIFFISDPVGMTIMMAGFIWCGLALAGVKGLGAKQSEPATHPV